ncbi:hypothetical protein ACWGI0_05510 [Streptomyces sp. NPDC054802]
MLTSRAALSALEPPGTEPPELLEPPLLEELLELLLELSQPPPEPRAPVSATMAIPKTAMART